MKILRVQMFCVFAWIATAAGCTSPAFCTLNARMPAISLSVRAPGGLEDLTQTARVDVARNGVKVADVDVQYPIVGTATAELIRVYGSGGSYSIIVHHAGYRDTTVTASVRDTQCGPAQPPVALIVNLTAL